MRAEKRRAVEPLALEHFLPYRLSVLSNLVSGRIAKFYEERFQLTIPEWRVMAVLGRFPGLTAAEVCEHTAMDKVQISRAVARLQKARRIEQRIVEGDRRARHLHLSDAGLEIYAQIVPLARELETRVTASLSAGEKAQLEKLLDKLGSAARGL